MTEDEERLLRDYAGKRIAWRDLRLLGGHYSNVLDGRGELGLRQPIWTGGGPNAKALEEGSALLRQALGEVKAREERDVTPARDWDTIH